MARTNHMENSSILSPSIRILRQPDSLGYQDFLPFDVVRKCAHWKMNLLANSKLYPHWVFLACDESIHVFHLNPIKHRCSPSIQVLQLPSPPEELLEIDRPTINYIRIFYLASIEILIAADSIGRVHLWRTSSLDNVITLNVDPHKLSVWGLALHSNTWVLATSSNSHTIQLFDLHLLNVFPDHPKPPSRSIDHDSPLGSQASIRNLVGHTHNIPCVAFNETGDLLLSSSIDCTVRIWEIQTGTCRLCIQCNDWMWQVAFLPSSLWKATSFLSQAVLATGNTTLMISNPNVDALTCLQNSPAKSHLGFSWLGSADRINMVFVEDQYFIALHQSGELLFIQPHISSSTSPELQVQVISYNRTRAPILGSFVQRKWKSVRVFIAFFDGEALIVDIIPGTSHACDVHENDTFIEATKCIQGENCAW